MDGTLSYADALQVLQDVAVQGPVSATEVADLKTIGANLETQNGITSSAYVASLFSQLVGGSAANDTWTGGAQQSSNLGGLFTGATTQQMTELIGKWFLGTDMPMPQLYGKPSIFPTYQAFTGPLFGSTGAPQIDDVAQGAVGDGEFLAGVADILENRPSEIASMFVDDGNGVYGVRFYVNGKETWVTVNDELPVVNGALVYNNAGATTGANGLWADLLEKAYVELGADNNAFGRSDNGYDSINGNSAYYALANLTGASQVLYLESSSANWSAYKSVVIDALAAHEDVVLEAISGGTMDSSGKQLLVANHSYSVIGYDAATGDFIVRNPWGDSSAHQNYVAQFEVSMADIAGVKGDFAIDDAAAPPVVLASGSQIVGQANQFSVEYYRGEVPPSLPGGTTIPLASLFRAFDKTGSSISQYMVRTLGDGAIQLNGAVDLANAVQHAAGDVVVSAADLPKLLLAGGASPGNIELFISGMDAKGWGLPADIDVTVDTAPVDILPTIGAIVSSPTTIAGLFKLIGPDANASGLLYDISIAAGLGQINLNGAQDLSEDDNYGTHVEVSAADLSKLTFLPMGTVDVLNVEVHDGAANSSIAQIPMEFGLTAATILANFEQGGLTDQVAVSDSAANIVASLDQLQQMMPSWYLLGITTIDTGIVTESISSATLTADRGVLSIINSSMILDVTATGTEASIEGLSNLATVVVYSGTASQYSFAGTAQAGTFDVTGPNGGVTALSHVVALQFSDHELFVASQTPVTGATVSSAQITELYSAVFSREPDVSGLNFYEQFAAANPGTSFVGYAQFFLNSSEYTSNTAHNYAQTTAGDSQFITDIYSNLLHRAPDTGAVQFYLTNVITPALQGLTAGTAAYTAAEAAAHAQVLTYISQSAEFLGDVQVTATHPADGTHWLVLI